MCRLPQSSARPQRMPASRSRMSARSSAVGERWLCAWCGADLEPLQTGWTDIESGSGEYCPEGQAVRDWGTSPHLPVRAEAATPPLDVRGDIDHAWRFINEALDKNRYGDAIESDLLEVHHALEEARARLAQAGRLRTRLTG